MKNKLLNLSVFLLSAPAVFAADATSSKDKINDNFTQFKDTIKSASTSAQDSVGNAAQTIFALTPVLLMVVGVLGGLRYLKKQTHNLEENFAKQLGYAAAGASIALLLGIVVLTAISVALTRDPLTVWEAISSWWKHALEISDMGGNAAIN